MDDYELERIGFDNPALIVPAVQHIHPNRQKSSGSTKKQTVQPEDCRKPMASAQSLTKYDVSTGLNNRGR